MEAKLGRKPEPIVIRPVLPKTHIPPGSAAALALKRASDSINSTGPISVVGFRNSNVPTGIDLETTNSQRLGVSFEPIKAEGCNELAPAIFGSDTPLPDDPRF
ncbi:MAG: hypothetical protein AAF413_04780 [Patescibacteria group bacterium]